MIFQPFLFFIYRVYRSENRKKLPVIFPIFDGVAKMEERKDKFK